MTTIDLHAPAPTAPFSGRSAYSHAAGRAYARDSALATASASHSLSASYVATAVATRPPGGKRRAPGTPLGPARGRMRGKTRVDYGRRAKIEDPEGVLVDAADAAGALVRAAASWDALSVLAHAEIAKMALDEAMSLLDEEAKRIGPLRLTRSQRARYAAVVRRRDFLLRASALLAEAHERHLVHGD